MFFFKAYNLNFRSEIYFPELTINGIGEDAIITFGDIGSSLENYKEQNFGYNTRVRISKKCIYFLFDDIYVCKISSGKEIVVNPNTKLDESFLRILILVCIFLFDASEGKFNSPCGY